MGARGCGIGIVGLGAALPATVRTNEDWDEPPHVGSVGQEAGVDPFRGAVERRVLESDRDAVDIEVEACREALGRAGRRVEEVGVLLGSSVTPTYFVPGNHTRVARRLGLGLHTTALGVDAACASFVPQLEIAVRLMAARARGCGLVYQSSAISRAIDQLSPFAPMAGDGAVAQVIGPVPDGLGLIDTENALRAELADGLILGRADGRRWTDPADADTRFVVMAKDLEAARTMMQRSPEYARDVCQRLLSRNGCAPSDVDVFVCTQPAADFADAAARAVGIPEGRWLTREEHFERFGHLMQASAPLNLFLAWQAGRLRVGDLVLVYTQGGGLSAHAALLRWSGVAPP